MYSVTVRTGLESATAGMVLNTERKFERIESVKGILLAVCAVVQTICYIMVG